METVRIQTESKNYDVLIGEDTVKEILPFLTEKFPYLTKVMLITDETVAALHLDQLLATLQGLNPVVFIAPGGEKAKTFDIYYQALSTALENHLDRKSLILSFGGGAVGDLSGFVAASFMRGIPFIQIPTTILAHDSAVGGKVAINHPLGKNMIGAFHQPEAVFYDLKYLDTLPPKEVRSGFAEVIKHALIDDPDFYLWLETNIVNPESITKENLFFSLVKGIKIKNKFVSRDERETGVRAFLNFGHTLGHAVESGMGYGNVTHGEAVMIGMVFALKLSIELKGLDFDLDRFIHWAGQLGYQTKIPDNLSYEMLVERMKQDKKAVGSSMRFVLLEKVGKPVLTEIADNIILDELKRF